MLKHSKLGKLDKIARVECSLVDLGVPVVTDYVVTYVKNKGDTRVSGL
jgi:hypothetical protein